MKTFDDLQMRWKATKSSAAPALDKTMIQTVIATQIRRERNRIFHYFWASYFWQFLIYVSLSHLLIRCWGDKQLMLFCITGIVMYLPFTFLFIKKYNRMAGQKSTSSVQHVLASLQIQYALLMSFFQFKKKFDWIGIPVTCLILTAIIFKLWVPGGWAAHFSGVLISYGLILTAFVVATFVENRKNFQAPLEGLRMVMKELQEE